MSRRSLMAALLLAGALAATARCGGGAAPSPRGGTDAEDEGTTGQAEPAKGKKKAPAPVPLPSEVALLSLEGIPMPPPAALAAQGGGAEYKGIGPPGPPAAPPAAPPAPPPPDPNAPPPRNLFAFEEDPAVVMERRKSAEEAAKRAQEASEKARLARERWQGPPPPPPPPQPPPIPFQFIGYFGPPEARIGVFTGPSLFLAKMGDTVQSQFKVVSIGYESAEIGFTNFKQTQRIPLSAGGK